jgi:hypothetical protein
MAGIAAYFGAKSGTGVVGALVGGLAARGDDVADFQAERMELAVRAGIPQVHTGGYGTAIVVDGVTEPSTVLARYADRGSAAVLGVPTPFGASGATGPAADPEPYAMALADADRGVLVLARCGAGPTLYYARRGGEVLVASEPAGLLAGGVPAIWDGEVIQRFLATGGCDDGERTFFAQIRQVLPGQVLEVSDDGVHPVPVVLPARRTASATSTALQAATRQDGLGVRLGGQIAGVALLGAVLANPERTDRETLPVYSAALPGDGGPQERRYADAVLTGLVDGTVNQKVLPVSAADLDDFLTDLGEPVPDPAALLAWCTAREAAGEVTALLDPAGADAVLAGEPAPPYLARLADRVTTRFGVALRLPYREVPSSGEALRCELAALAKRGLPAAAARLADRRVPDDLARHLLSALRAELYGTFLSRSFGTRGWVDAEATVADFGELLAGRGGDPLRFWREFVVERWLRRYEAAAPAAEPDRTAAPAANPGRQLAIGVAGDGWLRFPVRTRVLGPADRFEDTIGWYVAELVEAVGREGGYRRQLSRPWFLAVAAKPLAVAQGRVRPLWEVRPGWWARRISGFVRERSWRGLGNPWTMQLAIDEVGLRRLLFAAGAAACGRVVLRRGLFDRLAGAGAHAVSGPVEGSVYPANVAVAAAPKEPDGAAELLLAAARAALPAELAAALAGCGIVATDGAVMRVLGTAGAAAADFYAEVCADDPMGDRSARTPAAIVLPAPASRAAAEPGQGGKRRGRPAGRPVGAGRRR